MDKDRQTDGTHLKPDDAPGHTLPASESGQAPDDEERTDSHDPLDIARPPD
jgi:hypothetical protein